MQLGMLLFIPKNLNTASSKGKKKRPFDDGRFSCQEATKKIFFAFYIKDSNPYVTFDIPIRKTHPFRNRKHTYTQYLL